LGADEMMHQDGGWILVPLFLSPLSYPVYTLLEWSRAGREGPFLISAAVLTGESSKKVSKSAAKGLFLFFPTCNPSCSRNYFPLLTFWRKIHGLLKGLRLTFFQYHPFNHPFLALSSSYLFLSGLPFSFTGSDLCLLNFG